MRIENNQQEGLVEIQIVTDELNRFRGELLEGRTRENVLGLGALAVGALAGVAGCFYGGNELFFAGATLIAVGTSVISGVGARERVALGVGGIIDRIRQDGN